MKAFLKKNKKALGSIIIVAGASFTPVPEFVWKLAAPLFVEASIEAVEAVEQL